MPDGNATYLIADDHAVFRQGLRAVLLKHAPEATILEAACFADAVDGQGDGATPDLIIADLRMPDCDGFVGLRNLRQRYAATPILALSASEESEDVYQALEAGASGYLSKSASATKLLEVAELMMVGGVYVPRELVAANEPAANAKKLPHLTARQREVLMLVVTGSSNKEIGRKLGLSPGTIKAHLSAIMRQFGVNNRVRLLLELRNQGFDARDYAPSSATNRA